VNLRRRDLLLLLLVFILVYLLPLGARPLFMPDETRYAEIPREMIASGNWVVPHLNGLLYFEKPVLGYWIHAAAQLVFGETRFAVRFPSALATGLSALLVLLLARAPARVDPRRSLGALAALIFLTFLAVAGIGTFAVLDNLLSLFLTLALAGFFWASEAAAGSRRERGFLIVAGIGCGLAFLTKGFLALAVPALVVSSYLLWQKRWRDLLRMSWLPLLVALLVALPWSLAVHWQAPDFWNYFFWEEHVRRFFSGTAQHKQPPWYFLAVLPAMVLPWTFLAPILWKGLRTSIQSSQQQQNLRRYAICWLILPLLFFSASRGKLMTYILPCLPALAILMAATFDRLGSTLSQKAFKVGALLAAGLWLLLLVALLILQLIGLNGVPLYSQPASWLIGSVALICGIAGFIWSVRAGTAWKKLVIYSLAPLPFLMAAPVLMPDITLQKKAPEIFLEQMLPEIAATDRIVTDGGVVRAVCWSWKRNDLYLLSAGELDYGIEQPEGLARKVDPAALREMIKMEPGQVVLVLKGSSFFKWQKELPTPAQIRQDGAEGIVVARF
jgi:4-amino-4-deoxy-L-arabinose transferase